MANRFGSFDLEVDLDNINKKIKSKKPKAKTPEKSKDEPKKGNAGKDKPPKAKKQDEAILQAMAFGAGKGKGKKKPVNKNGIKPDPPKVNGDVSPSNVDDDWKQRDDQFVENENEKSLKEAMMLSKLDYESKEKLYAQLKKEQEAGKKGPSKKKKEKPVPMSLEEFNKLNLKDIGKEPIEEPPKPLADTEFFERLDKAARKTLDSDARHELYKATAGEYNQSLKITEYKAEIEKRDFEIQALKFEVESLKSDLLSVKTRNKKLCEVILNAEMKEKAELVVDLDKMSKVRDELTAEVSRLSQELEQERTRVSELTKGSGKKK